MPDRDTRADEDASKHPSEDDDELSAETEHQRRERARRIERNRRERAEEQVYEATRAETARIERASHLMQDAAEKAGIIAATAERQKMQVETNTADISVLKSEMVELRKEVSHVASSQAKIALAFEYLNNKLFGGTTTGDIGEFGKLNAILEGKAASTVLKYIMGIIAAIISAALIYVLIRGSTGK